VLRQGRDLIIPRSLLGRPHVIAHGTHPEPTRAPPLEGRPPAPGVRQSRIHRYRATGHRGALPADGVGPPRRGRRCSVPRLADHVESLSLQQRPGLGPEASVIIHDHHRWPHQPIVARSGLPDVRATPRISQRRARIMLGHQHCGPAIPAEVSSGNALDLGSEAAPPVLAVGARAWVGDTRCRTGAAFPSSSQALPAAPSAGDQVASSEDQRGDLFGRP
jgi:hypothetical protein